MIPNLNRVHSFKFTLKYCSRVATNIDDLFCTDELVGCGVRFEFIRYAWDLY